MTIRNKVVLHNNKEVLTLKITRMNVYLRGKIIEAWDTKGQAYYLFFYKNTFLTAFKGKRLKLRSFIEDSFKKGISFAAPHPIIGKVVHSTQPYKIPDFKQLLKKLHNHFSPNEKAFILTFFESFIPKKKLFKQIQEIFYEFRRNGQMFASYQIIRILHEFAPKNRWAKETINLIAYTKYNSLYREFSEDLLKKDAIYGEKLLYDQKDNIDYANRLENFLLSDGCVMDAAALALEQFLTKPKTETYKTLLERLQMVFSEEELCTILNGLFLRRPDFPLLQRDLLEQLLKQNRFEEAAMLIAEQDLPLSSLSPKALDSIVELILSQSTALPYEKLNIFLTPFVHANPEKGEKAIRKCISFLMKEYDIPYIENWLAPLRTANPDLTIFKKIDHIKKLKDNPDKQMDLGKLYYELKLYNQALECFSWEMELDESNPKPVEWLAKIYRELGLENESDAYFQLLENKEWYEESR